MPVVPNRGRGPRLALTPGEHFPGSGLADCPASGERQGLPPGAGAQGLTTAL